jgi:hypothetical protein
MSSFDRLSGLPGNLDRFMAVIRRIDQRIQRSSGGEAAWLRGAERAGQAG